MAALNCIAINPQWHDEFFLSFPLGLATIVSVIEQLGHNVQVVDFDADRLDDDHKIILLDRITPKPKIVLLTGMITNYRRILKLSEMVKSIIPDSIVILGGSLATTAPDSVLKKLRVDIFVVGEGETTIKLLLGSIMSKTPLRNVPGIKVKEGHNIFVTSHPSPPDITKTPRPCYELFPIGIYTDFYKNSGRSFEMYTSKGCPNSCVYCYRISGNKVRYRLVDEVVKEICLIKDKYEIDKFSFEDDNFGINKRWTHEFCEKVRNLDITFRFQVSINAFDLKMIDELQRSGLVGVSIGMESGSPVILNEMNKRIDIDKAEILFDSLRRHGIKYNATFIIGMPSEDNKTIEMTKNFILKNGFTTNYQLFFVTPYPGTKLYIDCIEKGIILNEIEYIEKLNLQDSININLTKYPLEKLTEWKEYILREVSKSNHTGSTWKDEALTQL